MPKRVSSKIASYIKPSQSQSQERSQLEEDKVISDLAKGFLQAQAKISQDSQQNNTDEVMNLLSKINQQLENLQTSLQAAGQPGGLSQPSGQQEGQGEQGGGQPSQPSQQQESGANTEAAVSQELKNLFSILLQNENQKNNSGGSGETTGLSQQQNQKQAQPPDTSQNQQTEQNSTGNANSITVQTAAQVLAQAQYELSNELEASLKKLKQVISESEQIANKISNLLGEENSQQ